MPIIEERISAAIADAARRELAAGRTIVDIVAAAGVPHNSLSRLLSGERTYVGLTTAARLARVLGIDLRDYLELGAD